MAPMPAQRSRKDTLSQLIEAVSTDDVKKVDALLAEGVEADARDDRGLTPLMHAARSAENPRIVKRLLAAGADPAATDDHGWNALRYAQRREPSKAQQAIVAMLGGKTPAGKDSKQKNSKTAAGSRSTSKACGSPWREAWCSTPGRAAWTRPSSATGASPPTPRSSSWRVSACTRPSNCGTAPRGAGRAAQLDPSAGEEVGEALRPPGAPRLSPAGARHPGSRFGRSRRGCGRPPGPSPARTRWPGAGPPGSRAHPPRGGRRDPWSTGRLGWPAGPPGRSDRRETGPSCPDLPGRRARAHGSTHLRPTPGPRPPLPPCPGSPAGTGRRGSSPRSESSPSAPPGPGAHHPPRPSPAGRTDPAPRSATRCRPPDGRRGRSAA